MPSNKIRLEKIHDSENCIHVKVFINDNDVGILYLKTEEADTLLSCIKKGIYSSDVELTTNIFEDESDLDFDTEDEDE